MLRSRTSLVLFSWAALTLLPLASSDGQENWPQWRGPQRDGISPDKGLLKEWPAEGPSVLWQVDTVGVGYSSVTVVGGRIYTQGDLHGVEHVLCLDAQTGKVLWATQPEPVKQRLAERVAKELKDLDTNKDETIDEVEAINRLGFEYNSFDAQATGDAKELATARTQRLFQSLDQNQDQKLTGDEVTRRFYDEFERIEREDKSADAKALATTRTAAWMTAYDKNADNEIDREEARNSIVDHYFGRMDKQDEATKKGNEKLTTEEIESYLQMREAGKDGVITAEEMSAYYANRYPNGDGLLTPDEVRGYFGGYRNGQGDGPRGTPTVEGDRVYTEGGDGDITCMEAATGKTIWHVNLSSDFGGGRPGWGYSESPLLEGDMLIVTPGGKQGTVLALDKRTGSKIWQSDEVTEGAHYSTPVVAEIQGVRTLVQFARESVFGLTLDGGRFLWKYSGRPMGPRTARPQSWPTIWCSVPARTALAAAWPGSRRTATSRRPKRSTSRRSWATTMAASSRSATTCTGSITACSAWTSRPARSRGRTAASARARWWWPMACCTCSAKDTKSPSPKQPPKPTRNMAASRSPTTVAPAGRIPWSSAACSTSAISSR